MREHSPSRRGKRGQALAELVVALVAILVLTAGLLEIGRLSRARLDAVNEARAEAASRAMSSELILSVPGARFLRDWEAGRDGVRHSRDDAYRLGDPGAVRFSVAAKARPEELEAVAGANPISALMTIEPFMSAHALVRGRSETRTIPLMPVTRGLLYNAESVDIESEAWLVWTQNLE